MLVAFQGFTAPPDGKKTGAGVANLCALGYILSLNQISDIIKSGLPEIAVGIHPPLKAFPGEEEDLCQQQSQPG